ncbi:hypothetical protein FisN_18Hu092 [Fistulifera solaris]|uniref:Uncharacterized protein n=1 Tax=Fistulifera solaris TaxID=1519565 RepID=A0A1Z5JVR3_FISSO|nr:hypothetical protein FisN_18Hu092 [Fistulifera solaris]|eukprot:GAX17888.1 hypothetical protein FisN_18Hu092 [Fistulifera solaris]
MKEYLDWTYWLDNSARNTRIVILDKTDDATMETALQIWGLHCPEEMQPKERSTWGLNLRNVFKGAGDAFVDALDDRESHFGWLHFQFSLPLSDCNIKRLVQFKPFDKLTFYAWDHLWVHIPSSAPVRGVKNTTGVAELPAADITFLDLFIIHLTV